MAWISSEKQHACFEREFVELHALVVVNGAHRNPWLPVVVQNVLVLSAVIAVVVRLGGRRRVRLLTARERHTTIVRGFPRKKSERNAFYFDL